MRFSLWIVTYNNAVDLNTNLESLLDTWHDRHGHLHINIINNHSSFHMHDRFEPHVQVHHNTLRSDHSMGHLSRNWNQAIMAGFGSLTNPEHDVVITSQDDVVWLPGWCDTYMQAHGYFDMLTQGHGDVVIFYTPQAIRRVGLWDERFSPSFYHEADYFLRSVIHNPDRTSINDGPNLHGRMWNPVGFKIIQTPPPNQLRQAAKQQSLSRAHVPWLMWSHKWQLPPTQWQHMIDVYRHATPQCVSHVLYPHFELAVEDLAGKKYLI